MDLGKDSNKIANGVKKMNKDGNKVVWAAMLQKYGVKVQ